MFRLTLEEGGVFTSCEIRTIHQVFKRVGSSKARFSHSVCPYGV